MSDLASVKQKVQLEASRFRAAVSEFVVQVIGKSVNYLIDKTDSIETVLEATSFSAITSVDVTIMQGSSTYTVPSGETFVGYVRAANGGTNSTSVSTSVGSFTITQFTTGSILGAGFAVTLTAGQTISVTTSGGQAKIDGFSFDSDTLVIP